MINRLVSSNCVTAFWDMPKDFINGCIYRILKNGEVIEKTSKTHFTAEALFENTNYEFKVELINKEGICISEQSFTCVTPKRKRIIDITKAPYNAIGDGKKINTKNIQTAIDDCGEDECVYIPAGDYLTGSLFLHSNMEIYIEKGGILHGTDNVNDYAPKIKSRFEGIEMMCYSSLLNIGELDHDGEYNCKNVTIRGEGIICGGGKALAQKTIDIEKEALKNDSSSLNDKISDYGILYATPERTRSRLINISNAQNVVLQGLTLENGASWNVHIIYSDNIITNDCTFRSEGIHNGDGWDPDSSTNCTIFNCRFYTGDDAVAIKSGKNPEGNIINRPCKNIRIFDCISYVGHGITIGSEMSGGVEDVMIWDCDMTNSLYGVEIKTTKKRGGYVKNVSVRNCTLARLLIHSVKYNDDGEAAPNIPVLKDCIFENLIIRGFQMLKDEKEIKDAIELTGFEESGHYISNVKFKNIVLNDNNESRKQTISICCCEGISLENLYCI